MALQTFNPHQTILSHRSLILFSLLMLFFGQCCKEKPSDYIKIAGRIVDYKQKAIGSANIHVNGVNLNSDSLGNFQTILTRADRYIMTVAKPGYKIMSKVFLNGFPTRDWHMQEGTTTAADPTLPITVVDSRSDCREPSMVRVRWENYPEARKVKLIQEDGSIVDAPAEYEAAAARIISTLRCNTGASVQIPANALENSSHQPPAGEVRVSVSTLSLGSPGDMPGDFTVRTKKGNGFMKSYGAMAVDVIDQYGQPLQLKQGKTAKISVPIDPSFNNAKQPAPDSIPLMVYNAPGGVWEVRGQFLLNKETKRYETEVNHFSEFNTDLLKENQACLKIDASAIDGDFELVVHVMEYIGDETTDQRNYMVTNTAACNGEKIHAVYNLPTGLMVMIMAFQTTANPEGEVVPLMSITFGSIGAPQEPTDPNRPVCPYGACQNTIVLNPVQPI